MSVIGHASVEAFFREVLLDSFARQGVTATPHTEHYLVGLLGNYAKAQILDEPLGIRLVASQSNPAERVRALKEVGDTSLYVSGFFAESVERKLVQADYYIGLGSAAYRELAVCLSGSSVTEVYEELAAKFPSFVDVLAEIRGQINLASADVVGLYQEWLESRSNWIEGRLRSMGVLIGEADSGDVH